MLSNETSIRKYFSSIVYENIYKYIYTSFGKGWIDRHRMILDEISR